jgi:hypothetical protein
MRASDASPRWLGLPALAGCGGLPRSVGLRRFLLQPPMQAGRSDLCFRHQHGSAGHSAWCVIRVAQLGRIRQVYHQLARDAELVAPAATHTPSYLRLMDTAWMQGALGHAARVCLCRISGQWLETSLSQHDPNCSWLVRSCVLCQLSGVVLSARTSRGAVSRYEWSENDSWCERALRVSPVANRTHHNWVRVGP